MYVCGCNVYCIVASIELTAKLSDKLSTLPHRAAPLGWAAIELLN